ncbi:YdaS family helix-turn-helix protein [uncultured Sphingomonas sp.]|uniref:transcriptional regulator n=1 Tax=uncultured Sphingomonas sp. TaxID=158754 RepID=UPI00344B838E
MGTTEHDDPGMVFAEGVQIIGSGSATARLLGVTQPTIWRWLKAKKACPAEHVAIFAEATGIPRRRLRPDLYADQPSIFPADGVVGSPA